jgi:hypothetical protein
MRRGARPAAARIDSLVRKPCGLSQMLGTDSAVAWIACVLDGRLDSRPFRATTGYPRASSACNQSAVRPFAHAAVPDEIRTDILPLSNGCSAESPGPDGGADAAREAGALDTGYRIVTDKDIRTGEFALLMESVGYGRAGHYAADVIERSLAAYPLVAHARDIDGRLVGYVSAFSDGAFSTFIGELGGAAPRRGYGAARDRRGALRGRPCTHPPVRGRTGVLHGAWLSHSRSAHGGAFEGQRPPIATFASLSTPLARAAMRSGDACTHTLLTDALGGRRKAMYIGGGLLTLVLIIILLIILF